MKLGKQQALLTSGELGSAAGVSPDTIRHYEKLGLLAKPIRTEGGYRLYPADALSRVLTIRSALRAGFSLAELAGVFKERAAGGVPCQRVAAMASEKVQALDEQIRELTELRAWLTDTVRDWQKRLERTPSGQPARLLESLVRRAPTFSRSSKEKAYEITGPHIDPLLVGRQRAKRQR